MFGKATHANIRTHVILGCQPWDPKIRIRSVENHQKCWPYSTFEHDRLPQWGGRCCQFVELCADPGSWDFEVRGFGRLWERLELIKHRISRPGPPALANHIVFGIERSASTERPLPGEAFSLAEKIGDPCRPENPDLGGFMVPAKDTQMQCFAKYKASPPSGPWIIFLETFRPPLPS